ncbi:cytochrome P450 4V2-like [Amblyomma americanum]
MFVLWTSESPSLSSQLGVLARVSPLLVLLAACIFLARPVVEWVKIWVALRPLPGPWDGIPFWYSVKAYWNMRKTTGVKDATVGFLTIVNQLTREYQWRTFKVYLGPMPVVVVHTPEAAETLLMSKENHRKPYVYSFLSNWLGPHNLVTATGDIWRFKRRLFTPAFHFRVLENYICHFNENGNVLIKILEKHIDEKPDEALAAFPLMQHLTLDIIGRVSMGTVLGMQTDTGNPFGKNLNRLSFLIAVRGFRPWTWIQQIYDLTYEGKMFKETLLDMEKFSLSVMQKRKEKLQQMELNEDRGDEDEDKDCEGGNQPIGKESIILDYLLRKHLEESSYTIDEVKKDIDTIIFGGNDTTTSTTSWALYLLGLHPEKQAKVHAELDEVFGSDCDRDVTKADVYRLKYLECCIKETLRLYPSIPLIGRHLEEDLVIDGYRIPKGVNCFINLFSLHKNPKYFKDPESFIPERFLTEEFTTRHPFSYLPFSGGPKNCIGQRFALLESKVIMAKLMLKFSVESTRPLDQLRVSYEVIVKARGGLRIWFRRRPPFNDGWQAAKV